MLKQITARQLRAENPQANFFQNSSILERSFIVDIRWYPLRFDRLCALRPRSIIPALFERSKIWPQAKPLVRSRRRLGKKRVISGRLARRFFELPIGWLQIRHSRTAL